MLMLKIEQMTCNHCVGLINRTIKALDPKAEIEADIANKSVRVNTSHTQKEILNALTETGYTATSVVSCCNATMNCNSAQTDG